MSALNYSSSLAANSAPAKARVTGLLRWAKAQIHAWQQMRNGRRAVFELYRMEDTLLRDIGLTRADIEAALLHEESDPSSVLNDRRTSAVQGNRATKREAMAALA